MQEPLTLRVAPSLRGLRCTPKPQFSAFAFCLSLDISGLYGTTQTNGAAETREIFGALEKILNKTGSDFRHLAKATYYVSTEEASTKLNEIRPSYYDPQRPPAASKAIVAGIGKAGRTITVDMIAVRKGGEGE